MSSAKWRPFCLGLNVLMIGNPNVCIQYVQLLSVLRYRKYQLLDDIYIEVKCIICCAPNEFLKWKANFSKMYLFMPYFTLHC